MPSMYVMRDATSMCSGQSKFGFDPQPAIDFASASPLAAAATGACNDKEPCIWCLMMTQQLPQGPVDADGGHEELNAPNVKATQPPSVKARPSGLQQIQLVLAVILLAWAGGAGRGTCHSTQKPACRHEQREWIAQWCEQIGKHLVLEISGTGNLVDKKTALTKPNS